MYRHLLIMADCADLAGDEQTLIRASGCFHVLDCVSVVEDCDDSVFLLGDERVDDIY